MSHCRGGFWGKHQLWVAATEQSAGAEEGVGEAHWPGAPELQSSPDSLLPSCRLQGRALPAGARGPLWQERGEAQAHEPGLSPREDPTNSTPKAATHQWPSQPLPSLQRWREGQGLAGRALSFGGWAWTMGSDKPPPRCSGDIKQAFHCGVLAVSVGSWHPARRRREGRERQPVGGGEGARRF